MRERGMGSLSKGIPRYRFALSAARFAPVRVRLHLDFGTAESASRADSRTSTVARALIPVPSLDPKKLRITYLSPSASDPLPDPLPVYVPPRRYTVTHNDLTANIQLSIGEDFNAHQLSGWYTALVRDEVCAEWCFSGSPALHVHCHVSGHAKWLAPPRYRNFVFKREMPIVLDSILYAESGLPGNQVLWGAPMFIHFESLDPVLSRIEYWGTVAQWAERGSASAAEHLAHVSYTLLHTRPSQPGPRLLPVPQPSDFCQTASPLDALYRLLSATELDGIAPTVESTAPADATRSLAKQLKDECSARTCASVGSKQQQSAASRMLQRARARDRGSTQSVGGAPGKTLVTPPAAVRTSPDDDDEDDINGPGVALLKATNPVVRSERMREPVLRTAGRMAVSHVHTSEMWFDRFARQACDAGAQGWGGLERGLRASNRQGAAVVPLEGDLWCVELSTDEGWRWFREWRRMS